MTGLLDFFGTSFDDPRTMGLLTLAQNLSTARKPMQGLTGGLLGYQQAIAAGKQAKQAEELKAMQMQQAQMAIEQQKREAAQREAQDRFRQSIPSPQMAGVQTALAGGGGPTMANAANIPATDPNAQLMHGALKAGLIDPVQYLTSLRKDTTPKYMNVAAGGTVFDERTGKSVFTAPKDDSQDPFIRLLKQSGIDPMSQQGQELLRQRLQKEATHQAAVNVSYGAPVAGVDESGKPVFFQPDKGGGRPSIIPGVAPAKEKMSAGMQEKFATNAVTLGKIDKALDLVSKNPDALGLKNYLGDPVMQRLDPGGTEVRAMIADIGGQKIHDRSGAAVTVGESARLKPYIPAATDSPEVVKTKLALFRNEYTAMQQALNSGASLAQAEGASRAKSSADNDPLGIRR